MSTARSRYNRAVLGCSLGYGFALVGATMYFHNHPGAHGPTAYFAAVAPALLIIGIFFAVGRYLLDERDEYVRMLMVRQTLIATALALSAATVWGFLTSADLAPRIDSYWIAVVWFGGLGIGAGINRLWTGREA